MEKRLELLYEKIAHGDEKHREWLRDQMEEFSKDNFGRIEQPATNLPFGYAIYALKAGKKVARKGWNGKGMWLSLVLAGQWQLSKEVPGMEDPKLLTSPWIGMRTVDNSFVPWLASQTDVLAEDWQVL